MKKLRSIPCLLVLVFLFPARLTARLPETSLELAAAVSDLIVIGGSDAIEKVALISKGEKANLLNPQNKDDKGFTWGYLNLKLSVTQVVKGVSNDKEVHIEAKSWTSGERGGLSPYVTAAVHKAAIYVLKAKLIDKQYHYECMYVAPIKDLEKLKEFLGDFDPEIDAF